MLRATKRKSKERFRGICADALKLGVDRVHLWRVLKGQRPSASLLRRYRQLKKEAA